jgi:hypothetical protein
MNIEFATSFDIPAIHRQNKIIPVFQKLDTETVTKPKLKLIMKKELQF